MLIKMSGLFAVSFIFPCIVYVNKITFFFIYLHTNIPLECIIIATKIASFFNTDWDLNIILKFFEHKLVTETVEKLKQNNFVLGELLYDNMMHMLKVFENK